MTNYIATFLIGVVCIALGISNMRGTISTLHSYHRQRVSEENRLPFGKLVGIGTVICGAGVMLSSIFSALAEYMDNGVFITIGTALMIIGLVLGLGVAFFAMIKYNKGIF